MNRTGWRYWRYYLRVYRWVTLRDTFTHIMKRQHQSPWSQCLSSEKIQKIEFLWPSIKVDTELPAKLHAASLTGPWLGLCPKHVIKTMWKTSERGVPLFLAPLRPFLISSLLVGCFRLSACPAASHCVGSQQATALRCRRRSANHALH